MHDFARAQRRLAKAARKMDCAKPCVACTTYDIDLATRRARCVERNARKAVFSGKRGSMDEPLPILMETSIQIAWDYLDRTGELGDPEIASRFLLYAVEQMIHRGERRRL